MHGGTTVGGGGPIGPKGKIKDDEVRLMETFFIILIVMLKFDIKNDNIESHTVKLIAF